MSEIAVGTFAVSDILPCLGDVSAAIGSASVIYGIIDTVCFSSVLFSHDKVNHCFVGIRN